MPLPKKTDKKEEKEDTISVSDDEEVFIKGPYESKENPDWGRSVRVETSKFGAFVNEKNLLVDISGVELRSFKDEKDKLKDVVKDTTKLKWNKNFEKGKGKGVDMGPTNEILTNGFKALEDKLDGILKIFTKAQKKKGG